MHIWHSHLAAPQELSPFQLASVHAFNNVQVLVPAQVQ
jgi:hypothetical protein